MVKYKDQYNPNFIFLGFYITDNPVLSSLLLSNGLSHDKPETSIN